MLCWLPGADPTTREAGERLTKRALVLYEDRVSETQREHVTIAVCEIDGLEVAVVYHPKLATADRIAGRLRKSGVAATATSGAAHAEVVLHQREPSVKVIGISNSTGPCPPCRSYFGETPDGFANVYWDSSAWI